MPSASLQGWLFCSCHGITLFSKQFAKTHLALKLGQISKYLCDLEFHKAI